MRGAPTEHLAKVTIRVSLHKVAVGRCVRNIRRGHPRFAHNVVTRNGLLLHSRNWDCKEKVAKNEAEERGRTSIKLVVYII